MTDTRRLEEIAKTVRYLILKTTTAAGSGHPTSSLSATDLMCGLMFGGAFRYDINQPDHPNNDRLIFSKGHASPLLYALWVAAGKVTEQEAMTFANSTAPSRTSDLYLPICGSGHRIARAGALHRRGNGVERQIRRSSALYNLCFFG